MDTCVLCSGCTAQWIVNLAGVDIGAASGAVNRTINVATGASFCVSKLKFYIICFQGAEILQVPRFSWVILVYVFHYTMYTLSGFLVRITLTNHLRFHSNFMKYFFFCCFLHSPSPLVIIYTYFTLFSSTR